MSGVWAGWRAEDGRADDQVGAWLVSLDRHEVREKVDREQVNLTEKCVVFVW